MKQTIALILSVVILGVSAFLGGCQSAADPKPTEDFAISVSSLTSSYQPVEYDGNTKISAGDYSFLQIGSDIENSSSQERLLYTLNVYDVNDNRQFTYEDITAYLSAPKPGVPNNVICKITPGGYFTLSVKSDSTETAESSNFIIRLSQ